MMRSLIRHQWIKRWVGILNRPRAEQPGKRRRRTSGLSMEQWESRLFPTGPVPTGNYSGLFTSNTEFNSTSGIYVINGDLKIATGVTLQVDAGVHVVINPNVTLTDNGTMAVGAGASVT